jgi:phage shock protein C
MVDPKTPIRRTSRDRMVGGVCAGLARWLGWDPSPVRVLWVLLTVFTGFLLGFVAYLALWIFIPAEGAKSPD